MIHDMEATKELFKKRAYETLQKFVTVNNNNTAEDILTDSERTFLDCVVNQNHSSSIFPDDDYEFVDWFLLNSEDANFEMDEYEFICKNIDSWFADLLKEKKIKIVPEHKTKDIDYTHATTSYEGFIDIDDKRYKFNWTYWGYNDGGCTFFDLSGFEMFAPSKSKIREKDNLKDLKTKIVKKINALGSSADSSKKLDQILKILGD